MFTWLIVVNLSMKYTYFGLDDHSKLISSDLDDVMSRHNLGFYDYV